MRARFGERFRGVFFGEKCADRAELFDALLALEGEGLQDDSIALAGEAWLAEGRFDEARELRWAMAAVLEETPDGGVLEHPRVDERVDVLVAVGVREAERDEHRIEAHPL